MCSPHCSAYNTLCRDTSVKDASQSHSCAYESGLCYFSDRCIHYIVMYVINHVKTYFFLKNTNDYGSRVDIFSFSFLSKFDHKCFLSIKIYLIPMCET